jgi:hypothetical protein
MYDGEDHMNEYFYDQEFRELQASIDAATEKVIEGVISMMNAFQNIVT